MNLKERLEKFKPEQRRLFVRLIDGKEESGELKDIGENYIELEQVIEGDPILHNKAVKIVIVPFYRIIEYIVVI